MQLWRCAPIAQGVGFAMVILSLIVSIYYNVIMAYALIYVGASFVGTYDKLPWTYCGIGTISLIIRETYLDFKSIDTLHIAMA